MATESRAGARRSISRGWATGLPAVALLSLGCPKEPAHDPKLEADGVYLQAQSAFLTGDFKQAETLYAKVRALNPNDPRLPGAEGEVFLSEGRLNDALKDFETAAKMDPKRATTWSRIGYIHQVKGEEEEAQVALDKALALNPKDFNALESKGELLLKHGDVDGAVKLYLQAAEHAPDLEKADLVLQASEELTKSNRAAEALPILEKYVKAGLKTPELLADYGEKLVAADRLPEAVEAYTQAAKANQQAVADYNAAKAKEKPAALKELPNEGDAPKPKEPKDAKAPKDAKGKDGKDAKDGKDSKEKVDFKPKGPQIDPTLWEVVGELQLKLEHLPEAEAAFKASMAIKDRALVHIGLARIALAKKDDAGAKAQLDLALDTASGEEIRETLDLADLLADMGRKADALKLLAAADDDDTLKADWAYQLKIAQWAKDLKDTDRVRKACDAAREADAGIKKCP